MTTNPDWKLLVRPGDLLVPNPLWNKTEQPARQMANPVRINNVKHDGHGESGVKYGVKSIKGKVLWLDAGWFKGPSS